MNNGVRDAVAVGEIDSEERGTGARRNSGKPAFSLVPFHLLAGCCRVFMGGKLKYAPWNWAKGSPWSSAFESLLRHLFAWWYLREDCDEESGEHHLDHVIANALFLRHFTLTYREGDDRPPEFTQFMDAATEFRKKFDEDEFWKGQRYLPEQPMPLVADDQMRAHLERAKQAKEDPFE